MEVESCGGCENKIHKFMGKLGGNSETCQRSEGPHVEDKTVPREVHVCGAS